ncbi:hypothetical protein CCYN74_190026 [Capnocytophaga cynodegmi]|uniref:Uncharacterized protein n=2 Tax=Capnocytophaga cynodegmi TaxID=28189 RepID=A0A0B7HFZ6_9FLAO|nr:hypothetical protein CCYN74_190026 [Capnocytophaga cynodegmi]
MMASQVKRELKTIRDVEYPIEYRGFRKFEKFDETHLCTYDIHGNITQILKKQTSKENPNKVHTVVNKIFENIYDKNDNLEMINIFESNSLFSKIFFSYFPNGTISSITKLTMNGDVEKRFYNKQGKEIASNSISSNLDPLNNSVSYNYYNNLNQLVLNVEYFTFTHENKIEISKTKYDYDSNGNIVKSVCKSGSSKVYEKFYFYDLQENKKEELLQQEARKNTDYLKSTTRIFYFIDNKKNTTETFEFERKKLIRRYLFLNITNDLFFDSQHYFLEITDNCGKTRIHKRKYDSKNRVIWYKKSKPDYQFYSITTYKYDSKTDFLLEETFNSYQNNEVETSNTTFYEYEFDKNGNITKKSDFTINHLVANAVPYRVKVTVEKEYYDSKAKTPPPSA